MSRSQKRVRHLQQISDDRKLEEREELTRRLNQAERELEDRTHRVEQLERHVENLEKHQKRELLTEMKKHAATKLELENLQNELEYTKSHLRVSASSTPNLTLG